MSWNVKLITDRALSFKKFKLESKDVTPVVSKLGAYVDYFNSLPADEKLVMGRNIEDIKILKFISEFITPNSVRAISGDKKCRDILHRSTTDPSSIDNFSYGDFMLQQETFVGFFKKDLSDCQTKTLGEIKIDVSISDIFKTSYYYNLRDVDRSVRYMDAPFIPTALEFEFDALFNKVYFNSDVNTVVEDFINDASLYE